MKKTFERKGFCLQKSPHKRSSLLMGLVTFLLFFTSLLNSSVINAAALVSEQQEKRITGKVTDKNGAGIPGASVVATGTTIGVLTDIDGNFTLQLPNNAQSLSVSFIGFESQVIQISNQTIFNVTMNEAAIGRQEVVVIGYGKKKRADLTGSVSSMPADHIKEVSATRVEQALVGKIAGVEVR